METQYLLNEEALRKASDDDLRNRTANIKVEIDRIRVTLEQYRRTDPRIGHVPEGFGGNIQGGEKEIAILEAQYRQCMEELARRAG